MRLNRLDSKRLFCVLTLLFAVPSAAHASDPNDPNLPSLSVSKTVVSFTAYEGGSNPSSQTLSISNTGVDTLNWTITDANEPTFLPPGWLTITPLSGGPLAKNQSSTVSLSVNIAGLSAGAYSYALQVAAPEAPNSPKIVTVKLQVTGPILAVSKSSLSFTSYEGGANPANQTLTVSNSGGGTVDWTITNANEPTFSPPTWLTIAPVSGALGQGQSEQVTLSVDIMGLTEGFHSYLFQVADPLAANSPRTVSVKLRIGVIHVPTDYPTIQAAINAAIDGDTIIVSPGTYYENINFKGKNIILTSTNPNDPNIIAGTIIHGSRYSPVVHFSGIETADCILQGFTITRELTSSTQRNETGIYGGATKATIADCVITGNKAYYGGGGLFDCDGTITNCTITRNTAYDGGGLFGCDGTITNCTITRNTAYYKGGGLSDCDGTITHCTISSNKAVGHGGGLFHCRGLITNCTIIGNTANHSGGGLVDCDGTITHCTISSNNSVTDLGGGLSSCGGFISNCIVSGNTARGGSGLESCDGFITNCTIVGNRAVNNDWGHALRRCEGTITNCIIWGNFGTGSQIDNTTSTPSFSCIQDWTGGGTGNISGHPSFLDTSSVKPNGWDLHLLPFSACVDAGTNTPAGGLPATDIEGTPRPTDGDDDGNSTADMGAYESQGFFSEPYLYISEYPKCFCTVAPGSDPAVQTLTLMNLGTQPLNWSLDLTNKPNWLTVTSTSGTLGLMESADISLAVSSSGLNEGLHSFAFEVCDPAAQNTPRTVMVYLTVGPYVCVPDNYPTIQAAIDAAIAGDTIVVFPGIYFENIRFNGKDITLTSTNPNDRSVVNETIIDGFPTSVVTFSGSETSDCVLSGFTITNGGSFGILGNHTQATINSCRIANNRGPGLCNCDGPITNCTITGNTDVSYSSCGGGLKHCDGPITNCTVIGNTAYYGGGLAYCMGPITNCTIIANTARRKGGGLDYCNGLITNCIIWNNTAENDSQLLASSTPAYSCIQDWIGGGTGNISSNPLFADVSSSDPNFWDWHLKSEHGRWDLNRLQWVTDNMTSPCIDTGHPASDWTAELWPHGARINMGAYGGTAQASMSGTPSGSIADLNCDDYVNGGDFALFSADWLVSEYLLNTDLNRDGCVDFTDFAEFAGQWLTWNELPRYLFAPGGLTASPLYCHVSLNWADPNSPYCAGYNVYRSTTSGSGYNLIAENLQLSTYSDLDVANGITYYYVVTAVSTTGNESAYSIEVAAKPDLAAPTGLSATASYGQVSLNWNDHTDPSWSGFNVYRRGESDPNYILIAKTLQISDYNDVNVTNGIWYYYRVTAVSIDGYESAYVQILARPDLAAPAGLSATVSYGQVSLNWNDHTSPYWAGFNVYRSTTYYGGYIRIADSNSLQVSDYSDYNVTNGNLYYYRVTAVSFDGYESAFSNPVTAMPGRLEYQGFESGFGNWANVTSGDTDQWYRDFGETPTSQTGPDGGNGSNYYVYMEASDAYMAGESAILLGPEIADSGRARAISFYYHMYGADMGTLNVDVYSGGNWTNAVRSISGQQHTSSAAPYTKAVVDLSAFTGTIRVRFRGVAAGGYRGDIATDDILIYEQ